MKEYNKGTQLRKNEAIVVAEADKGNVMVVMDVVDYDKKAEEIINNYPFKAIAKDPTRKVESGIIKCVRQFFLEGKIKKPTYDWLRASSC